MPYDNEKLLKATYEILKSQKRGMVTIVFRHKLSSYISEDEDYILLKIEDQLIKDGWIHQDKKSRLLTPTKRLITTMEENL